MRYPVPPLPMIPRPLTDAEKTLALLLAFRHPPSLQQLKIRAAILSVRIRLLEIRAQAASWPAAAAERAHRP